MHPAVVSLRPAPETEPYNPFEQCCEHRASEFLLMTRTDASVGSGTDVGERVGEGVES